MEKLILKIYNKQIIFLLTILGFSMATNKCAAQYGAPVRFYEIKGVVLSKINEPISKIKIVSEYDSTYSDSIGNFTLIKELPYRTDKVQLKFIDEDKTDNGNYYNKDTTLFTLPDKKDQKVTIKLESKN